MTLQEIVASIIRIEQSGPGILDEFVADCWAHVNADQAAQADGWTQRHERDAWDLGRRIAGLLGVTPEEAAHLVADAAPTARRRIVAEVTRWYLARLDGPQEDAHDSPVTPPPITAPEAPPIAVQILPPQSRRGARHA